MAAGPGRPRPPVGGPAQPPATSSGSWNQRFRPAPCIFTSDSGSATNWYARYIDCRGGCGSSLSGTLATMLPGVPYAIAAKFAFPDRPVIGFTGDGAFSMLGMNELFTVKR